MNDYDPNAPRGLSRSRGIEYDIRAVNCRWLRRREPRHFPRQHSFQTRQLL